MFGPDFDYTGYNGGEMGENIEDSDEDQVAKGQSSSDLRIQLGPCGIADSSMSDNCGSTQNSGDRLKGLHKRSADDFRTPSASRNSMLDVPVAAGPEEAPLMEAVDNLGDFLRFVEWSTSRLLKKAL